MRKLIALKQIYEVSICPDVSYKRTVNTLMDMLDTNLDVLISNNDKHTRVTNKQMDGLDRPVDGQTNTWVKAG